MRITRERKNITREINFSQILQLFSINNFFYYCIQMTTKLSKVEIYLRFHRKEAKRDKVSVKHDTQTVIPQEK